MTVKTNASDVARVYGAIEKHIEPALLRGITKAVAAVDKAQVTRLAGSNAAEPGSYPVPARTGHLLGAHFFEVQSSRLAIVGNAAAYAEAIHEGFGSSAVHGRRPFLDDAADAEKPGEIVMAEVSQALMEIA